MTKKESNNKQTIHNPHDKALFNALKNHAVAKEVIQTKLPQEIVSMMTLKEMRLYKTKLVNPNFKEFEADVFYEVPINNLSGLILFHCEHQSTPEKDTPLRIWEYILLVLAEYLQNNPKKPLPIVYPLIIYTGEQLYTYSTNLFDLFGDNKALAEKYLLRDIQLVDVCRMPDEEIRQHQLFGLTEYAFKHKRTQHFEAFLDNILPWMNEVNVQISGQYATLLIKYILDVYPEGSYEKQMCRYFVKDSIHPCMESTH